MVPSRPSSHRARKKKTTSSLGSNQLVLDTGNDKRSPAFPLVSFLWSARAGVSQWLILPLILMAVGLFRWAVSLWGYSGAWSIEDHVLTPLVILLIRSRLPSPSDAR